MSQESGGEVSPDGQWLAYQSNESGGYEVYVRPLPDVNGSRVQISTGGGVHPAWARHGRELYYLDLDNRLTAVTIRSDGSRVVAGLPAILFEAKNIINAPNLVTDGRPYDVASDDRFLMINDEAGTSNQPYGATFVVVNNWQEELKRLVAVP
jgi:serine/threonine-protein kinase